MAKRITGQTDRQTDRQTDLVFLLVKIGVFNSDHGCFYNDKTPSVASSPLWLSDPWCGIGLGTDSLQVSTCANMLACHFYSHGASVIQIENSYSGIFYFCQYLHIGAGILSFGRDVSRF